jgi:predicted MFS family arabinose efflux permease
MKSDLVHAPIDDVLIKMIVAIVGAGIVFGGLFAGYLVERTDCRKLITGTAVSYAIIGCAPFFLSDLHIIVPLRFLLGVPAAIFQATAITMAAALFDARRRAQLIGYMMAGGGAAGIVTTPFAGWLGAGGWRDVYLIYLASLVLVPLAYLGLSAGRLRTPSLDDNPSHLTHTRRGFPLRIVLLSLVAGLVALLAPLYFVFRLNEIGITRSTIVGVSYLAMSLPEIVSAAAYGRIRAAIPASLLYLAGFGGVAVGLSIVATASTYFCVLCGMAIHGMSFVLITSNVQDAAASDSSHRGRTVSLMSAAIFLSFAVGTLTLEAILHQFGAAGILLGVAAICATLVPVYAVKIYRDRRLPVEASRA